MKLIKTLQVLLLSFLISISASSQVYQKTISTDISTSIKTITSTRDEGFILGMEGGGLVKLNKLENIEWSRKYINTPNKIIQCNDKGYIFSSNFLNDIIVTKTDSIGNFKWSKIYGGIKTDVSNSILQINNHEYLVIGYTESYGAGNKDIYLFKIDSLGNLIWTKTYGTTAPDMATDICSTKDGGFIILGKSMNLTEQTVLVKIDSIGNVIWAKAFYDKSLPYSSSVKLFSVNEDKYILLGSFGSIDGSYGRVICTDSVGNLLWNKSFGFAQIVSLNNITVDNDKNFFLAGYWERYFPLSKGASFLLKIDKNGNYIWGNEYGYNGSSKFYDMFYNKGELVMVGSIKNSNTMNGFIVKTDTNTHSLCNNVNYTMNKPSLNENSISLAILNGGNERDTIFTINDLLLTDSLLSCYCNLSLYFIVNHASCNGCNNGTASITPTGGKEPYTYLWDTKAYSQTDSTATGLSAGTYYVTVTDSNNCISKTNVTIYDTIVNISSFQKKKIEVQLYPNPSNGQFTIEITNNEHPITNYEVKIMNLLGQTVYQQTLNTKQETIDTQLPKGLYMYKVFSEGELYAAGKVVVR